MKIKEAAESLDRILKSRHAEKLLIRIGVMIGAFIISNASVFGEYSPFGVSMAAAVPFPYMLFSFAGFFRMSNKVK